MKSGKSQTGSPHTSSVLEAMTELLTTLQGLQASMEKEVENNQARLATIQPHYQQSARNLLHYLAMRRMDLQPVQLQLARLGLSSLGRAESHVMDTVTAVIRILSQLTQTHTDNALPGALDFSAGEQLLSTHSETLLGAPTVGREVRIMVTMPGEAAKNDGLIQDLLKAGMNCMRINCAHDSRQEWLAMITHLRQAEQRLGLPCKVVMDLSGPKLRTGPVAPGPTVTKARPTRGPLGEIIKPGLIWLTPQENPQPAPTASDCVLPLPADWLSRLRQGDSIKLLDARHARRSLKIVDTSAEGCWAETRKTCYFVPGTILAISRDKAGPTIKASVGMLPGIENSIPLCKGDLLILTRDLTPGRAARLDSAGDLLTPARIGCTLPGIFEFVRVGESIWFNDGKIGAVIEKTEDDRLHARITHTRLKGAKLKADQGINLPDTRLKLPALTHKDLEDLQFAAEHADVIELSFANHAADVDLLQRSLANLGIREPAVVLKIETQRGFFNLPDMLLTAMRSRSCGVMIARGDLAVECGFERMAEVQEEILWICESAHVPVIWATQVLETLAREGMPSRAEITDAAMGNRAECVMLNKGPHVLSAVHTLDDILRRMRTHQNKKRAIFRALRLANLPPL
jgi:pyruvate kinase